MLFICVYNLKIQPSEFENLYFYEIGLLLNEYKEYLEEKKRKDEEQEKEYKNNIPNMNSFNIPKVQIPNYSGLVKG